MGKSKKIYRTSEFRKLGELQCTYEDAAGFLGISKGHFQKIMQKCPRLRESFENGKAGGRVSLRRKQFNLATTNAPMAIHLGKIYLGQDDKKIFEHQGPNGGPVQTVDLSSLDANNRNKLRELLTRPASESD